MQFNASAATLAWQPPGLAQHNEALRHRKEGYDSHIAVVPMFDVCLAGEYSPSHAHLASWFVCPAGEYSPAG